MARLIKLARYTPGTPGTAGVAADPGEPPVPAHLEPVTRVIKGSPAGFVLGPPRPSVTAEELRLHGPITQDLYFSSGTPDRTVVTWVLVPATPGRPPRPAIPAVPPTPATEFGAAWDGGATSISFLDGDIELEFNVRNSAVGVVCGLSSHRGGAGYEDIEFALYFAHGIARPMESGQAVGPSFYCADTDRVRIVRRRGVVQYYVVSGTNPAVLKYTSGTRSVGAMSARASLYSAGDAVYDASLKLSSSQGADATGLLQPLVSASSNKAYTRVSSSLAPLTGTATGLGVCRSSGLLPALTGLSANRTYATSAGTLRPLNGEAHPAQIVPSSCMSGGMSAALFGASTVLSGGVIQSSSSLVPLSGKSADHNYAESASFLAPPVGVSFDVMPPLGYFSGGIHQRFALDAYGRALPANAVTAQLPPVALVGFAGASLRRALPSSTFSGAGSVLVMGRLAASVPAGVLAAAGTIPDRGGASAAAPRPRVVSFSGGVVDAALPPASIGAGGQEANSGRAAMTLYATPRVSGFAGAVLTQRLLGGSTLHASASVDTVAQAVVTAPRPTVGILGSWNSFGAAVLLMPMPTVSAAPNGAFIFSPLPSIAALGGTQLQPWSGAWVFNLAADPADAPPGVPSKQFAATGYTNYPFLRIVRFDGHNYGVSPTGVYRLRGGTDDGSPIPWAVETHISDFGSLQLKGMTSAYIGAHLGPQALVKAVVGERGSNTYSYPNAKGAAIQNHRVLFGRGMRSRYYGVRIEDKSGGELHMDNIALSLAELSRKI